MWCWIYRDSRHLPRRWLGEVILAIIAAEWLIAASSGIAAGAEDEKRAAGVMDGKLLWRASEPLLAPVDREGEHFYSVKDPTFVQHEGKWHVFCTVRGKNRSHQIEYFCFDDWKSADQGTRTMLGLSSGYYCAPSVFYFRPQRKWYLIYQYVAGGDDKKMQPGFSTSDDIGRVESWTRPAPLIDRPEFRSERWIDFWVICDATHAYLFYTSNDGRMWRMRTAIGDFPRGWGKAELALSGNLFEASHTYRLKGQDRYLTVVEAIGPGGRRYYQSYTVDRLDGVWKPAATEWERPFAGSKNVRFAGAVWAESISHGELVRAGSDERMEIDPGNPRFVFQGALDAEIKDKPYGQIPWRLGMLELLKGDGRE